MEKEKIICKNSKKINAIQKASEIVRLCSLQAYSPETLVKITSRIDNVKSGYIKGELSRAEKKVFNKLSKYDVSIRQARDWFKALCLRPKLQEKLKQGKISLKEAIKLNSEIVFRSRLTKQKILEEIREAFDELEEVNNFNAT